MSGYAIANEAGPSTGRRTEYADCRPCDGSGYVPRPIPRHPHERERMVECEPCDGSGRRLCCYDCGEPVEECAGHDE